MIKKIEFSAEIKGVRQSLRELETLLKKTTSRKERVTLFDKTEMDSMKSWATQQVPLVRRELAGIRSSMKSMSDTNLLLKTKQQAVELEKTLKRLEKMQLGKMDPEDQKRGISRSFKLPGRVGGGGLPGMGMLGFGGLAGLVGLGISRGMKAYGQRVGEVPSRLGLAGAMGGEAYRGFGERGGPYQGKEFGYDVNETLSLANQLVREVGNLGSLSAAQRAARAYGLEPGQLAGQMGMLRRVGGAQNVEKNFSLLIGSAVASDLEQGLIGGYLGSTAKFIEEIATKGTADARQIATAVSGLVRQGGLLQDTQRTTQALGSLHQAIRQSTGARFGFFAQSFERMLGDQAPGSQVLYTLQQGLFGGRTGGLQNLSGQQREALAGPGVGERAAGVSQQFSELTRGMDVYSKALVASKLTGIQDAGEAFNFMNALKQGKFTEAELQKKYEEARATPEEKAIQDLKKTIDNRLNDVRVSNTNNLSQLGASIAPGVAAVRETMLNIEGATLIPMLKGVSSLVKHFVGEKSIGEKTGETLYDMGTGGKKTLTDMWKTQAAKTDLYEQLSQKDQNPLLRKSLMGLRMPGQTLNEMDIDRIKTGVEGATPEQRKTIAKQAYEKVLSETLTIARGRKTGSPVEDEEARLETIRQTRSLIPKGSLPPKSKVSDEILKMIEEEKLGSITGGILQSFPRMKEVKTSSPISDETGGKIGELINFNELKNSIDSLNNTMKDNDKSVQENTRSKNSGSHDINKYRQGKTSMINARRG